MGQCGLATGANDTIPRAPEARENPQCAGLLYRRSAGWLVSVVASDPSPSIARPSIPSCWRFQRVIGTDAWMSSKPFLPGELRLL